MKHWQGLAPEMFDTLIEFDDLEGAEIEAINFCNTGHVYGSDSYSPVHHQIAWSRTVLRQAPIEVFQRKPSAPKLASGKKPEAECPPGHRPLNWVEQCLVEYHSRGFLPEKISAMLAARCGQYAEPSEIARWLIANGARPNTKPH